MPNESLMVCKFENLFYHFNYKNLNFKLLNKFKNCTTPLIIL